MAEAEVRKPTSNVNLELFSLLETGFSICKMPTVQRSAED